MLTPQELHDIFNYDPETGALTWKTPRLYGRIPAGTRAGRMFNHGYMGVCVGTKTYMHHRVAFAMTYDRWPDGEIDHINGDKADNRLANLREATQSQNSWNRGIQHNNKCGIKGVYLHPSGKWIAQITICGDKKRLGCFDAAEEAGAAYRAAALKFHGEFHEEAAALTKEP